VAQPLTGAGGGTPPAAPALVTEAQPPLRLLDLRAVLVALLVLLVGAALGAAWFAAEQHSSGLPRPVRAGDGWTIAGAPGHPFNGLSLSGDALAWQDGALVLYMDLRNGRVHLLGPGPGHGLTWQPAASSRYVVWFEGDSADAARVYSFDLASRRRRAAGAVVRPLSYVRASGGEAVWTQRAVSGALAQLVVLDLAGGRRRTLAVPPGQPTVDGALVALARQDPAGDGVELVDLATGAQRTVVSVPSGTLTGVSLSGRRLAWVVGGGGGQGRVLVQNVDTGISTLVATGAGLLGPSLSGELVVWAQAAAGGDEIMGRRLGGGPAFRVAAAGGDVQVVRVSGRTVAWLVRAAGGRSVIHTTQAPG
jgi:hypothetical protein